MAVNDQVRYFYNILYSDEMIATKLEDYQNSMYNPIVNGKEWIQNNRIINGNVTDIQIDQRLNMKYGMPSTTYSLFLNINIIPFYSEKDFYLKYGYEKIITTSMIMDDDKVFSKYMYFFISGYLIHDVELVVLKSGHTIIFLHPTTEERKSGKHHKGKSGKLHKDDLERIMDEEFVDGMWSIMFSSRSDVYETTKQRIRLFGNKGKDTKIYLKDVTNIKKFRNPHKSNAYTLYLSASPKSYNMMAACSVTVNKDSNGEYFDIPPNFKKYIYSTGVYNIHCLIFNEPECNGNGIYVNSEQSKPVFQIPYKKNPIPPRNLLVWQYNHEEARKMHPLEANVSMIYPNIYDFSEMIEASYHVYLCDKSKSFIVDRDNKYIIVTNDREDGGESEYDLYIEWVEPEEDVMLFDSYIQDYIDYKNSKEEESYTEMVVNNELPEEFTGFDPAKEIKLSAIDYYHSEFYPDYRAWKLDCFKQLLQMNPRKYDKYYHELYFKIRLYFTRAYNYLKERPIYDEREIYNNKEHCKGDSENSINFDDVAHTYLHIYDYQEELKPMNLFIGGILSKITYAFKRGQKSYIYIEKDLLKNKDSIQLDLELNNKFIETAKLDFKHSDEIDLETINFKQTHSLSSIVFYDEDGNYIDEDNFEFEVQINRRVIEYDFFNDPGSMKYSYEDFYTFEDEEFIPKGSTGLVVKTSEDNYPIENVGSFTKDITLDSVTIRPKAGKYENAIVNVSSTDFSMRKTFLFTESLDFIYLYDSDRLQFYTNSLEPFVLASGDGEDGIQWKDWYEAEFKEFKGKPSKERFKVYADGRLKSPETYEIEFNGYGKTAIIRFDETYRNKRIDVHYSGFDDEVIYDGDISVLTKGGNKNVIFLGDYLKTPYDSIIYRIFINGYRISADQIHPLGQSNMLYIDYDWTRKEPEVEDNEEENTEEEVAEFSDEVEENNELHITIYGQKMDEEIYGYTKDSQFLDRTAINDEEFLEYLVDKYVPKVEIEEEEEPEDDIQTA